MCVCVCVCVCVYVCDNAVCNCICMHTNRTTLSMTDSPNLDHNV